MAVGPFVGLELDGAGEQLQRHRWIEQAKQDRPLGHSPLKFERAVGRAREDVERQRSGAFPPLGFIAGV